MRLATITNWAYGATVALALVSSTTMLMASAAQDREREAVETRYRLDKATNNLGVLIYAMSDHARQYVNTGDPTYRVVYQRETADLGPVKERIRHLEEAGVTVQELDIVEEALRWGDTLHDEQEAAIAAYDRGDEAIARQILFGAEYERELDRAEMQLQRFRDRLDNRIATEVAAATHLSRLWKTVSEIALGLTALLFFCVLFFVFRQRVLRPVVKLSDVVARLAEQDFAVDPPEINQIDEIGDMAKAISVFRENGIERQRLEAERSADAAVRDLISRMTQRMQGCDSLDDLQDVVARFVPQIAPWRAGRLYLLDEKRNALVEKCSWLGPVHSQTEFPPTACWALRRGTAHAPGGDNVDVPCLHLDLGEPSSIPDTVCLPLTAQRDTFGLLYLEARTADAEAADTPPIYLNMLAENIGLALANLKLRDALRELAMIDSLTGLANRRELDANLQSPAMAEAAQNGPLSCLMVDVDHFKRFNDIYGHEAGDRVLREVGAVLKRSTREPELAFRYGGEEFLLLLPGLTTEQAVARAEEIRSRIAAIRIDHQSMDIDAITVSIGIACAPRHCTLERLVQSADAALLHAKVSGRDRVEVAGARDGEKSRERRLAASTG